MPHLKKMQKLLLIPIIFFMLGSTPDIFIVGAESSAPNPAVKQIPLALTLKFSDASVVKGTLTLVSFSSTGATTPLASWGVPAGGVVAAWVPDDTSLQMYQLNYVGAPRNGSITLIPGLVPTVLSTVHRFSATITLDRSTGNLCTPFDFQAN